MVFPNLDVIRKFNSSLIAVLRKYRVSFPFKITILHSPPYICLFSWMDVKSKAFLSPPAVAAEAQADQTMSNINLSL